jgi:type II secretory pathway pseudopilin PulG
MNRKLIVVLVILGLVMVVALPKLYFRALRHVGTRAADGLMATINAAQVIYARTHPDKGFASSLAELGPSPGAELIDGLLASGKKSGYVYILTATPPDSSGRVTHYTLVVRPDKYTSETASFFTDETGVERFTFENRVPTENDPVRATE